MKRGFKKKMLIAFLIAAFSLSALSGCEKKDETSPAATPTVSAEQDKTPDAGEQKTDDKQDNSADKSDADTGAVKDENIGVTGENDKAEDDNDEKESDKPSFSLELPEGTVTEQTLGFDESGKFLFNVENEFSSETVTLNIVCPSNAKVYYTLDGTTPTEADTLYTEPIKFAPLENNLKEIHIFRAVAIFETADDYYKSSVATRSFFVAKNVNERFCMDVFSVIGEPAELTDSPKGILYGLNYKKKGRENEKMIYLEAFKHGGSNIFSQYAGARVYGGYSRQYAIKSLKFFARKSYDEDNTSFKFKQFDTPKQDGSGKEIKKYDRLVLRSHGNDFQFLFLRDELSQALVKQAGFMDYESCVPAVAYVNGKYYGFFWLHENYCDKYFKEKYGKADGNFIVAEGSEKEKAEDEDIQSWIDDYNAKYAEFSALDLTDDANFQKVSEFMDVNNYLDYMSWNIAINNFDWPNNNYKCYRFVPDEGASTGEGVFDGRWRFLPHDMDYAYGLYDQRETLPGYDTLKIVLKESDNRGAPLLAKLLERKDCRAYFKAKTYEYFDGVLDGANIIKTYEELDAMRKDEMPYYFDLLKEIQKTDWSVWASADSYAGFTKSLYDFAEKHEEAALRYLEEHLPDIE